MDKKLRIRGLCLVTCGTLLWGVSGTVAQFLFQEKGITSQWLVVVRMIVAGNLLLAFGGIRKDKNILLIWKNKKDVVGLIIFALLGMLGVQYSFFASIQYGNAATATILQYLAPVIIMIYITPITTIVGLLTRLCIVTTTMLLIRTTTLVFALALRLFHTIRLKDYIQSNNRYYWGNITSKSKVNFYR